LFTANGVEKTLIPEDFQTRVSELFDT